MCLDLINIRLDIVGVYVGGQPTIKGDGRLGHYDTTHTDQFQGRWNAAPPTLPAVSVFSAPSSFWYCCSAVLLHRLSCVTSGGGLVSGFGCLFSVLGTMGYAVTVVVWYGGEPLYGM